MGYLFILLAIFIGMMFLMQIGFFELTRKKMVKDENVNWFLSLNKPFSYNRVKYMIFLCTFCYIITGMDEIFTLSWFVYLVLFVAMGIVADAIVQYLTIIYGKKRCHKEIQEAALLENELLQITQAMYDDMTYEESEEQYDDEALLQQYLQPEDHLGIISVDQGQFADSLNTLPEATYVVEPYGDIEPVKEKLADKQMKVTKLTPSGQLPFKDEKMDIVMCEYSNYDKFEIKRVLKNYGYMIINQRGTTNLKEFYQIYMPFGMKGTWDAYSCAGTLTDAGLKVLDKQDDYGTIRFHSVQSIHSYFKKYSPEFSNINKYKIFYLKALKSIKEKNYYELSTHRFYVIAQKVA